MDDEWMDEFLAQLDYNMIFSSAYKIGILVLVLNYPSSVFYNW